MIGLKAGPDPGLWTLDSGHYFIYEKCEGAGGEGGWGLGGCGR